MEGVTIINEDSEAYLFCKNVFCKNVLSVKHILLECPITTVISEKNVYYFNDCNNVRDILYNTDIINSVVKDCSYSCG